ncbi:hypothetical protein PAMC26510_28900 [Caballeronia sordidicola]|uniref:Sulfur carrier protein ThiS n=1 Tax=Caballeronia sordidicola TaxID=196367 RepID=A0A242MBK9_CABSO|nr:hypothetical protein PAMC26510_28900 [Caballeronia sordidicola]
MSTISVEYPEIYSQIRNVRDGIDLNFTALFKNGSRISKESIKSMIINENDVIAVVRAIAGG